MKENISNLLPKKKPGLLSIYFHVSENSGVGYYRQYLWAKYLQEMNLANVLISDFRWGEGEHINPDHEKLFAIANWADLFVIGRLDRADWIAQWGGIREFFNMPMIMDTDDNVRFVRPSNPGYQGYHPGAEAIHWNKVSFRKVFDAITVSTDNLKEYHEKEHPKIFVIPNSIDFKHFKYKPEKKNDGKIRIDFNGSGAHPESIMIIKKPIIEIMRKYPQVLFSTPKIFKYLFDDVEKEIKDRIDFYAWSPLKDFPKAISEKGIDIGLAPLADNMFNRAKSNLRWMEYTVSGIPVICSPVEAYKCVEDEKTGLIAREKDEWFKQIERLVLNPELCYTINKNAYDKIYKEFNIEKNVKKVLPIYKEVVKKYHNFFGDKKRFRAESKGKWRELKW